MKFAVKLGVSFKLSGSSTWTAYSSIANGFSGFLTDTFSYSGVISCGIVTYAMVSARFVSPTTCRSASA